MELVVLQALQRDPGPVGGETGMAEQELVRAEAETTDALRPARKKRTITAARKEQNREAQRAFRRRQREHRKEKSQTKKLQRPTQPRLEPRPISGPSLAEQGSLVQKPAKSSLGEESKLSSETVASLSQTLEVVNTTALQCLSAMPDTSLVPLASLNAIQSDGEGSTSDGSEKLGQRMPTYLADPKSNSLQLLPTTIFSAILHNALALGFDLDMLATCGPETLSPFYRPSIPADDPSILLSSILSELATEPPDTLRPTLTQVLIPHHASLDLIPLPQLRDRAIMLSAAMPELFNLWELKVDIYQHGGLTVWRRVDDRRGGSSQPWDQTSWEAAPWFLRKWSMAVDGEHGELGRQSRWWQSLRGLTPPT